MSGIRKKIYCLIEKKTGELVCRPSDKPGVIKAAIRRRARWWNSGSTPENKFADNVRNMEVHTYEFVEKTEATLFHKDLGLASPVELASERYKKVEE